MKNSLTRPASQEVNALQLVREIATRTGLPPATCARVLIAFSSVVGEALKEDRTVMLGNLGTFKTRLLEERSGTHPITQERVTVPAHVSVRFSERTGWAL